MSNNFGRQALTLSLVVGAVVFGMILSAGTGIVPDSLAQSAGALTGGPTQAVHVDPQTGGLPSFADLAEAVSPAVVLIQTTKIDKGGEAGRGGQGQIDPFEFFFGPQQRRRPGGQGFGAPENRREDASGSGFLVSPDGHIVTNHHVIEGATELQVQVGNRLYKATVKGDDPATDLALIKIEPEGKIPFLQLADSDGLRVGDWIMVIGSPLRLQNSVSVGVVSAKGRSINITAEPSLENFIQTDAAINFGNSGGPLVNLRGEVVGIATAINAGASNIGFAVPANTLASILPQLRDRGSVSRGYLGVNITDLDFEMAQAFGLKDTDGALVTNVMKDSPGAKAGLANGDILLQVDDRKIRHNRDLIDYVATRPPGATVTIQVFRNGKTIEKKATLGERPRQGGPQPDETATTPQEDNSVEWLGLQLQDVEPMRDAHGIPAELKGVWITSVEPDSPLYERNVRPNDVLIDLNGEAIGGTRDLQKKVGEVKAGDYLRFYVGRFSPQTGEVGFFYAITRKP